MQKWEYCAIAGVTENSDSTKEHLLCISYYYRESSAHSFTESGCKNYPIKSNNPNALAEVIAKLGLQGWEMVGCANIDSTRHVIYFKRPIEE